MEPLPMVCAYSPSQVQPDVNDHMAIAVQDSAGLTEHVSWVDPEVQTKLYLSSLS